MEYFKLEQEFLSVDKAFESALNKALKENKSRGDDKNSAYIWRQRYKKGTLSHKKIAEILEDAGFKKVVEEKWILINKEPDSSNLPPSASKRDLRAPRTESMNPVYRPNL